MPRSKYSWETAPPSRRKGRLWRWLVLLPVLAAVAAAGIGTILFFLVRAEFASMAKQFDLERLERMESASLIHDRKGGLIGKLFIQNRDPVPYDKLPQLLVQAVVSTEDQRYWAHDGVDYLGVARAAIANWTSGRIRQGASTVTQQLARNSFDLKERTYRRKLLEIALAHRIEENFPKEKIMELYLNRVYFGGGLYGAEAAARGYFGVPAASITAGQAAMLAGLLKSPNSLSPWTNREAAQDNRNFVLGQMRSMGFLTSKAYEEAVAEPLIVRRRPDPNKQSYAMDYVRQQAINSLGYDRAMNGGFRIFTTLDPAMQLEAEKALRRKLDEVEKRPGYANQTFEQFRQRYEANPPKAGDSNTQQPEYLQGAILTLDNKTGGVLVMVGGRDFFHSEYNRSVQGRRPLGTAFVPLVYAAAFEKGLFPGTVVQDWALDNRLVGLGGGAGILGEWGVERADNQYEGDVTAREALVRGKNGAVVRVGFQTGLDAVGKLAREAGIASPLRPYANSYLGSSEVTLEEAVMAYTMFPGAGTRPAQSHIIQRIEEADGDIVYDYKGERKKVVADSTAWQVHSTLSDVISRGTGSLAMSDYGLAVAGAAGKTGTSYNFTDVWFLGYDDAVTCGVWVGFDRPRQIYRGAFGKDLALPIWVDVMNASRADFPSAPMKAPVSVEQVDICRVSGELATDKCTERMFAPGGQNSVESTSYAEYVRVGHAPKSQCSIHAGGLKSYVKEFIEEEWPRAAVAVDLSKIAPVNVSSSPVVGGADPYNTITPAIMDADNANVPVAEAVAVAVVSPAGGQAPSASAPAEIRKAEAAGVKEAVEFDFPQVSIPEPPPIRF
ncbi:MAG: transglycosylase domain-containing protein [Chthoniobacterales bacterium]|nr:transglycosylase domain-containing protein [Chthoniobacterales bacterium]